LARQGLQGCSRGISDGRLRRHRIKRVVHWTGAGRPGPGISAGNGVLHEAA
jgi:hypothetical protein